MHGKTDQPSLEVLKGVALQLKMGHKGLQLETITNGG